jgi:hypothetical protein
MSSPLWQVVTDDEAGRVRSTIIVFTLPMSYPQLVS